MGQRTRLVSFSAALLTTTMIATGVQAGGFDRGGVNIGQLFDEDRFGAIASVTYVSPRRTINNIRRVENIAAGPAISAGIAGALPDAIADTVAAQLGAILPGAIDGAVAGQVGVAIGTTDPAVISAFIADPANAATVGGITAAVTPAVTDAVTAQVTEAVTPAVTASVTEAVTAAVNANPALAPQTADSIDVDGNYFVPRFGIKFNAAPGLDCLLSYTEPFGADAGYGEDNAYSVTAVEFTIDTQDYGATCAYQFGAGTTSVGDSFLRIIGGVSYQELQGFQSRQRFSDFARAGLISIPGTGITNSDGIGFFSVDGDAFGWRAGVAYEIPDIALRAMILYHSEYDYSLSGVQDNTGFGATIPGTAVIPISIQTEIPQALEVNFQTGVREGTLAFVNFKWQDWSQLGVIPIQGGLTPIDGSPTALSFDPLYQDGYTVSAGVGQAFTEDLSAVAALTWDQGTSTISGTQSDTWTLSGGFRYASSENLELSFGGAVGVLEGGFSQPSGGDAANDIFYDFDADFVYAATASVKVKF